MYPFHFVYILNCNRLNFWSDISVQGQVFRAVMSWPCFWICLACSLCCRESQGKMESQVLLGQWGREVMQVKMELLEYRAPLALLDRMVKEEPLDLGVPEDSRWIHCIQWSEYISSFKSNCQESQFNISAFMLYLSVRFFNSCCYFLETKRHSSLFLHWSGSKFIVVMAACTLSIHVFLGCPLFLLSCGIQFIIILVFSPLASFWHGHTIVVFSAVLYLWCLASLSLPLFPLYVHFLFVHVSFPCWLP